MSASVTVVSPLLPKRLETEGSVFLGVVSVTVYFLSSLLTITPDPNPLAFSACFSSLFEPTELAATIDVPVFGRSPPRGRAPPMPPKRLVGFLGSSSFFFSAYFLG
jgi:hypothetical protein